MWPASGKGHESCTAPTDNGARCSVRVMLSLVSYLRDGSMKIICISRGSHGFGIQLAEELAVKLGCRCIARESLTDEATAQGIPVGRIETAIVKRRPLSEEMEIQVDRFKAFMTASLCEKAAAGEGIVYHGRTGHLVLPGVSHVFRVRAIAAMEERIDLAMTRMNITRDKAKEYISQVEEDRRRWVRTLYNADWDDPSLYDIVINTQHLSVQNASAGLTQMAQLPEFQPTPASQQVLQDLQLASLCRLAIGRDARTASVKVVVKAEKGHVSITYLPRQAAQAASIPDVVEKVGGVRSLICTVATTNILLLQETFNPQSESLQHLIQVAEKWNAAVELLRFSRSEEARIEPQAQPVFSSSREYDGGILEEDQGGPQPEERDPGFLETIDMLIRVGRAGGSRTIYGGTGELLRNLNRAGNYSLIAVGDLFLQQPEGVRKRLTRDLIGQLSEKLRVPVIETAGLKARYLFGRRQLASMIGCLIIALLLYVFVFSYQSSILGFLTSSSVMGKLAAAAAVGVCIPLVAFVLGGFFHDVLRLIRIE
jgi:cytidylate kinase